MQKPVILKTKHGRSFLVHMELKPTEALSDQDRARRVLTLCRTCLTDIAFYRAGWVLNRQRLKVERLFWVEANAAFIQLAIINWCKLFAEDGRHHWRRIIKKDRQDFLQRLLIRLGLSETSFEDYTISIKRYRDKFVAHLDDGDTAQIPYTWIARSSAAFLYDYARSNCGCIEYLRDFTSTAASFYRTMYRDAWHEYNTRTSS